MDDFAVARTDSLAERRFLLENNSFQTSLGQTSGTGESNDAGTNDQGIYSVTQAIARTRASTMPIWSGSIRSGPMGKLKTLAAV